MYISVQACVNTHTYKHTHTQINIHSMDWRARKTIYKKWIKSQQREHTEKCSSKNY